MNLIYQLIKKRTILDGVLDVPKTISITFCEDNQEDYLKEVLNFLSFKTVKKDAFLIYQFDETLSYEAYKISVDKKIIISSSSKPGFYYATKTLKSIFSDKLKKQIIEDEPSLKTRGFLLDISRNKVPNMNFLFRLIKLMAELRMNHLELYVEGFSFEFKSFKKYLSTHSYITVEEYKKLEKEANKHFIDLVPNVNGFGHMADWLKLDEFKSLSEKEDGIELWGTHRDPSTLNPLDKKSVDFVKVLYNDILPFSNSKYFNMNFDEPFELGKGKSKLEVEKKGLGVVYTEYFNKLYKEVKKYNKTPLIWGDVLINHPEALSLLPKDVLFVDWGYDASYPYSRNLKMLYEKNVKFLAAPGTSSWCSILGRTFDSFASIYESIKYTKIYHGEGIILTSWGDMGHLQPYPIMIAPLVYAGLFSYNCEKCEYYFVKDFINSFYKTDLLGETLLYLGRYNEFENAFTSNGTYAFHGLLYTVFSLKLNDPISYFKQKMEGKILSDERFDFLIKYLELGLSANLNCEFKEELIYGVEMTKALLYLNQMLNKKTNKTIIYNKGTELLESAKLKFEKLFLKNYKSENLPKSLVYFEKLKKMFKLLLEEQNG